MKRFWEEILYHILRVIFQEKSFSSYTLHKYTVYILTKFQYLIAFTSLNIGEYVEIVCFSYYGVINFEINLIFTIKPFFYMTGKSRQYFKYLENKKRFQGKIKIIFHYFLRGFSCQKLFRTWEFTFNGTFTFSGFPRQSIFTKMITNRITDREYFTQDSITISATSVRLMTLIILY